MKTISVLFNLVIFMFVLISSENQIDSCVEIINSRQKYICYESPQLDVANNCEIEINYEITNTVLGEVTMEFNPCGNTDFTVILSVREKDEKNSCSQDGKWDRHSSYSYERLHLEKDVPKCSKMAVIQLNYIFSGCYKIEVIANYKNFLAPIYKDFKTECVHDALLIAEEKIVTDCQQRFADNKAYLISKFNYTHHPKKLEMCFHLQEGWDDRLIWNISCPVENGENSCRVTTHGQKPVNCTLQVKESLCFNLECTLFGLLPGIYRFEKYIINEPIRCNTLENEVWGRFDCLWNRSINFTEDIYELRRPNLDFTTSSSIYFYGLSILTVVSLTLVLVYVLFKKIEKFRRLQRIPVIVYDPDGSDYSHDEEENIGILLLYARDADAFMETMSSFRKLLQSSGHQVFDIYDIDQLSAILTEGPTTWLLHKIMDVNIRIVLVLSECGNSQIEMPKVYKKPENFDALYNYGVRILLAEPCKFSCNNLLVAKFSFFHESRLTCILSAERRFDLDDFDNFKLLIRCLFDKELEEIKGGSRRYVLFDEMCEKLKNFVRNNCNYSEDILDITSA